MVSPRPVPPYFRVEPSPCENASKMVFCWSSGIPMPVSDTCTDRARRRVAESRFRAYQKLKVAEKHRPLSGHQHASPYIIVEEQWTTL